jgi:hypothetical protein
MTSDEVLLDEIRNPMNIFYLDRTPRAAARAHCDRHVVKMILETAQLLSAAWHVCNPELVEFDLVRRDKLFPWGPEHKIALDKGRAAAYLAGGLRIYQKTHPNHPSAVWARESTKCYDWLWRLGIELADEYSFRYGRQHASVPILWALEMPPPSVPSGLLSEPTPAMADDYVVLDAHGYVDALASYRKYYREVKAPLLKYTRRAPPGWCADLSTVVEV